MVSPRPVRSWRADVAVLALLAAFVLLFPPARHTIGEGLGLLATGHLGRFRDYLQSLGRWAVLVSIALMVVQALIVPLPVTIIMMANGLVFGLWPGTLVSLAGALLGALAAYAIGRGFGRGLVERLLPASALREADRLMQRYGAWAIVAGRWVPGVPCDPMSYAAGLTRVPPGRFSALTIAGLLPANVAMALVGVEAAGDIPTADWIAGWGGLLFLWLAWRLWLRRKRGPLN
jgi:uncharacterized membrane protein YdjX (TVP38/TMEM64 family)